MSPNKNSRKKNPLKPQRNFKNFLKFLGVAVLLIILVEYVILKGERPYVQKWKDDYQAEQALEEKAIEEVLPPKVIFPDDGSQYFEAPELQLKDEQSMLPEREFNISKLLAEEAPPKPKKIEKPKPEKVVRKPRKKFTGKRAKIAIVIDDVGMNIKQSRAAINLPAEVTLAMLPYAATVRELANEAKGKGHELIIHTPMEAMSADVPLGGMALYDNMDKSAFTAEFNKIAGSFDGYVGINNHMGSRLTQNSEAMSMLMEQLKTRGLFFLDSKTIGTSIAANTARQNNVPYAERDVFLDHEDTPEFLRKALKNTESVARNYGTAIAIGHPKKVTMNALKKWIPTLEKRGFDLVPLSALIHYPQNPAPVVQEAKIEEPEPEIIQNIEPAAGMVEEVQVEAEYSPPPLNFDTSVGFEEDDPQVKRIQIVKEGLPHISYPVE